MDVIDLLTPVVAVLSLFAAVLLAILLIRQSRRVGDLEERVASGGGSAGKASLDRIAELQARIQTSSGSAPSGGRRALGVVASSLVLLGVLGAGAWYVLLREPAAKTAQTTTSNPKPERPKPPIGDGTVPDSPPALPNGKSAYTVSVFNGSNTTGAAAATLDRIGLLGYTKGNTGNAGALTTTVVMFPAGSRIIGWNVAYDLGVKTAKRLDGLTTTQIANADAVVVLGSDGVGQTAPVVTSTTP